MAKRARMMGRGVWLAALASCLRPPSVPSESRAVLAPADRADAAERTTGGVAAPDRECSSSERPDALDLELRLRFASLASCDPRGDPGGFSKIPLVLEVEPNGSLAARALDTQRVTDVQGCILEGLSGIRLSAAGGRPEWIAKELAMTTGGIAWSPARAAKAAERAGAERDAPVPAAATHATGTLRADAIASTVRSRYPIFRTCGEQTATGAESLGERVTLRFVIERDGSVRRAVALTSTPDCAVAECARRVLLDTRFPAPEGGVVTVQYPFLFQPS